MKIKVLLLAFLVCWSASADFYCQPDPANDLIVTGVAVINNNYQSSRQKCYDIPLDAVTKSRSIQAIAVPKSFQGYNGNWAMDYSVQIGQSNNGVSIVLMTNSDNYWRSIQVSYLITARSDLWVGSFVANTFPFLGCWRSDLRSSVIQTPLASVGSQVRRGVVAFVSGLRTQSKGFYVDLKNLNVDERLSLLSVAVSTNAVLEFVQISYIVYDLASPLEIVVFSYFNADQLARRVYGFTGVAGFVNNGVVINSLGFGLRQLACQGYGCPGNCISAEGCKKLGGYLTQKACILCRSDQIISNGQCVKPCGPNYIYSATGCVCDRGFIQVNKQCLSQCAPNAVTIKGQCTCLAGYYANGGKCVPIPTCGQNQYFDGSACSCLNSNYVKNKYGKCELKRVCRQNQVLNGNNQCVCLDTCWRDDNNRCWPKPICRDNQQHDGRGKCQCVPSCWKNQYGLCVPKPYCNANANQKYNNNGGCDCIDGYFRNYQNICVRKPVCTQYESMNDKFECICIPGCSKQGGICLPIPSCPGGKIVDQRGFCVCPDGYVEVENVCRKKCQDYGYLAEVPTSSNKPTTSTFCKCFEGYYRPKTWQKCQAIKLCTQSNQIQVSGRCECEQGYIRNSKTNKCDRIVCSDPNQIIIGNGCQCRQGWVKNQYNRCELRCGDYEDSVNGNCVCKPGCGYNSDRKCYPICKNTQVWSSAGCVCRNAEDVRINGQCTACPAYSRPRVDRTGCECIQGYTYDSRYNQCYPNIQCPANSNIVPTANGYKCLCIDGYIMRNNQCVRCHDNSYANPDRTQCICLDGHYYQARVSCCVKGEQPRCPARSVWNYDKKQCDCSVANEYLISGECRTCGRNEGWNGRQCVCATNYNRVNGVCVVCDNNTYYDGSQCVCNIGFYGVGDRCYKCHESCGKCTGPAYNQCLTCTDVSYNLNNGCCTRGQCPVSLFYSAKSKQCQPCSSNCAICRSQQRCDTCISGFQLKSLKDNKQDISYCVEVCGDGRRFQLECDDGNKIDGDGCNCNCQQQKGWHCSGGTSRTPSYCVPWKPDRCMIVPKGAVHLFGRVVQGVRLSYIPDILLENDGAKCNKLLLIKVIKSDVVPGIRVSFVPKSRYQFYIQFQFNGLMAIPVFQFTVQLNPDFKQYFSLEDMAQLQSIILDPATLSRPNENNKKQNELNLSQIDNNKIKGVEDKQTQKVLTGQEKPEKE